MTVIKSNYSPGYGTCILATDGAYYYLTIGSSPEKRYSSLTDALAEYYRYCPR